jgi:hypothetical protein
MYDMCDCKKFNVVGHGEFYAENEYDARIRFCRQKFDCDKSNPVCVIDELSMEDYKYSIVDESGNSSIFYALELNELMPKQDQGEEEIVAEFLLPIPLETTGKLLSLLSCYGKDCYSKPHKQGYLTIFRKVQKNDSKL